MASYWLQMQGYVQRRVTRELRSATGSWRRDGRRANRREDRKSTELGDTSDPSPPHRKRIERPCGGRFARIVDAFHSRAGILASPPAAFMVPGAAKARPSRQSPFCAQ
jgi:hypothetical protein